MRVAVGDHATVGEQHRPARASGGELGVVRGHDHRLALVRPSLQLAGELGLGLPIHAPRRLIQRDHGGGRVRRLLASHNRERQALALAAGQIARVAVREPA